ncbi:MAG: GMC family oxidoreductase [Gammaproteobacteria bacterium]|nr:GMC family oxidoreductase [Gammaproteobacteria bacterium]
MNGGKQDVQYDVVIVGSGAGGSAAAWRLARAGLRVALVEKGPDLPRDGSTLDIGRVVGEGAFKSRELWLDGEGRFFRPEEYFNLGGKTRWYGAALLRYGSHEFEADAAHDCPGWPLPAAALGGYYQEAERRLRVRSFDCEPDLARIIAGLRARAPGWRALPLPLGLRPEILANPAEARHFDGFASVDGLKGDAETAFLGDVRSLGNLRILTGTAVTALTGAAGMPHRITGVQLADGRGLRARCVVLAAGALHSPRLLQRYLEATGLAASLPCAGQVGRNLKLHLLTAMLAIGRPRPADLIRKTALFINDAMPHSSVQPLGFDGELISTLFPRLVPRPLARLLGAHAYGFFLQTEDGAHPDNRVIAESPATRGLPVLDYAAARTPAALREHRQLVRGFRRSLARIGLVAFDQRVGLAGTAHASGTLTAGSDPRSSVVDANGQVHGMTGLCVVDGSVLPRSSRVNPSLTIYAWSLRVSDLLAERLTREDSHDGIAKSVA